MPIELITDSIFLTYLLPSVNKGIFSTKKPDIPKKPEVKIEYNNRSIESYISNGFADYIPRSVYGPRDRMLKFLNKIDLRKGPLERTVTTYQIKSARLEY